MIIKNYASVLIFLCFSINTFFSLAADTISANQPLSGDQTIVSSGGNFELGFFSPGKSSKYYIGIWYKKVSEKTVAWVANRETPILDKNSAQLTILDGNLVLLNEFQIKIWSTDLNHAAANISVSAVLLDDGNLVLRQGSNSKSSSLWESFNNLAHTWMPGSKLVYNKRTKMKTRVFSWKNSDDPAPGLFSLEPDPNNRQYIIRQNMSRQYWTSGPWNGQIFSLIPEMRYTDIYNFSYVDNENESYFMYWLYNTSIITRSVMDVSGQIKQSTWMDNKSWIFFWTQPRQQCEVYAYCGAFGICQNSLPFCNCLPGFKQKSDDDWKLNDYSGGCVRESNLQCVNNGTNSNMRKDKFMMISNVSLPEYSQLLRIRSIGECESACLSNCSCTAYAYDENGCSLWNGELLDLKEVAEGDGSGQTTYIRLSAYSSVFRSTKNDKGVVVGASVGSFAVVMIILAVILAAVWRCRRQTDELVQGSLVAFGYKDLQMATTNFSDKLGGGGFGSVFRGTLPDSTAIAVKKLESINQGEKQFRTEVSTIGTIQHVNLVRLLGFCPHGKKKLLVYEYMKNGSLDSHLFNHEESKVLQWKTRYHIALGIARGLSYLHEKCRDRIIHCDIKPENILLDAEFCPKVGDFGLAKLVGRDFSRVLTTMRGTRGYLAPEWISGVAITTKADVYSYGMMLFELVSGRRNSEHLEDGKGNFFPSLAANVMINGGDVLHLLDPILNRDADVEEVSKLCKVACWCVQDDENIRPSMGQVEKILEGVMDVNLPPIPRSLQVLLSPIQEHIVFFVDSSSPEAKNSTSTVTTSPCKTTSSSSTN